MMSWVYWAYKNWGTRTSGTAGTMASHNAVVDVLVRPYPPAIAGIPQGYSFDRDTHCFELTYTPREQRVAKRWSSFPVVTTPTGTTLPSMAGR